MDIGSGNGWPSSALSNFAPHCFELDGVLCNSMEGFLQSLKFKNIEQQNQVCLMVGRLAKFKGKNKPWWTTQTLWWRGTEIDRHGREYQVLLDRAYEALSKNEGFKEALSVSGNEPLTHSIGKNDSTHTILTEQEFCDRLLQIRKHY